MVGMAVELLGWDYTYYRRHLGSELVAIVRMMTSAYKGYLALAIESGPVLELELELELAPERGHELVPEQPEPESEPGPELVLEPEQLAQLALFVC